jgi:hypothetical protein
VLLSLLVAGVVFSLRCCKFGTTGDVGTGPAALQQIPAPTNVIFLSDYDEAYNVLEGLQRVAFEDNTAATNWPANPQSQRIATDYVLSQLRQLPRAGKGRNSNEVFYRWMSNLVMTAMTIPLPTRYENPIEYLRTLLYTTEVEKVIGDELPSADRPRIGSLCLETLNAKAIYLTNSAHSLIIINSGLFAFCEEMDSIALATVSFHTTNNGWCIDSSDATFDKGPRCDTRLSMRLFAALERVATGSGRLDNGAEVTPSFLKGSLANKMIFFDIAHEYAHIVYRHTAQPGAPLVVLGGKTNTVLVQTVARSWGEEAFADATAYAYLEKYVAGEKEEPEPENVNGLEHYHEFGLYAPVMYFALCEIVEEAVQIWKTGDLVPEISPEQRMKECEFLIYSLRLEMQRLRLERGLSMPADSLPDNQNLIATNAEAMQGDHPPASVRGILAETEWSRIRPDVKNPDRDLALMAFNMTQHVRTLWKDLKPTWRKVAPKGSPAAVQH